MAKTYDRNAIARSLGYRNYYEVRIRGGLAAAQRGEITPETARPEGRELARARGHSGLTDLMRELEPGSTARLSTNIRNIETDDSGDFETVPITISFPDGEDRDYWLDDISWEELEWMLDQFEDYEVDYEAEAGSTNIGALVGR